MAGAAVSGGPAVGAWEALLPALRALLVLEALPVLPVLWSDGCCWCGEGHIPLLYCVAFRCVYVQDHCGEPFGAAVAASLCDLLPHSGLLLPMPHTGSLPRTFWSGGGRTWTRRWALTSTWTRSASTRSWHDDVALLTWPAWPACLILMTWHVSRPFSQHVRLCIHAVRPVRRCSMHHPFCTTNKPAASHVRPSASRRPSERKRFQTSFAPFVAASPSLPPLAAAACPCRAAAAIQFWHIGSPLLARTLHCMIWPYQSHNLSPARAASTTANGASIFTCPRNRTAQCPCKHPPVAHQCCTTCGLVRAAWLCLHSHL